jgi:hypothetical protein
MSSTLWWRRLKAMIKNGRALGIICGQWKKSTMGRRWKRNYLTYIRI